MTRAWFRFFGRDYRDGTRQLTLEERGAYAHVITLLYDSGGRLRDDDESIARDMGAAKRVWRRIKDRLLAAGKLRVVDGFLTNDRVTVEVAEAERVSALRAEAGQSGGRRSGATRAARAEVSPKLPGNLAETSPKLSENFGETSPIKTETECGKPRKNNGGGEANASILLRYTRASPQPQPQSQGGSDEPPLRVSLEREQGAGAKPGPAAMGVWLERLAAAQALAGPAVNLTSTGVHHFRDLKALCEPTSGEPCDWEADVLPAIQAVAGVLLARGQQLRSWGLIREQAVKFRDVRLLGDATHATPVEPAARRLTADEPYTDDLAGIAAQAGLVNGSGKAAFAEWRDWHLERGTRIADRGASFARWLRRQKPEGVSDGRGHGSDRGGGDHAHGGAGTARSGRQQRRPRSDADILAELAHRARDGGL